MRTITVEIELTESVSDDQHDENGYRWELLDFA
jgi:hypothetical protein